jgi:hypothetical protein
VKAPSGMGTDQDYVVYTGLMGALYAFCEEMLEEIHVLVEEAIFLAAAEVHSTIDRELQHFKTGWYVKKFKPLTAQQVEDFKEQRAGFHFQIFPKIVGNRTDYEIISTPKAYTHRLDNKPDQILSVSWEPLSNPKIVSKIPPTQWAFLEKMLKLIIEMTPAENEEKIAKEKEFGMTLFTLEDSIYEK